MRKRQIIKKTRLEGSSYPPNSSYFSLATYWMKGRLLGLFSETGYSGFSGGGSCALFSGYKYKQAKSHTAFYELQARIAAANPHYKVL